jgi:hypothetical protein
LRQGRAGRQVFGTGPLIKRGPVVPCRHPRLYQTSAANSERVAQMSEMAERGSLIHGSDSCRPSASCLSELNPEQHRAVAPGVAQDDHIGIPLLIIAGAGSGRTNTLAHRVAHLIVSGADPRRILLMTFSAVEKSKRVERITRKVLRDNGTAMRDAPSWAGTFHRIGTRLLRNAPTGSAWTPALRSTTARTPPI